MGEYILFIIVMAVALAMDAFAVAVTLGMDGAARTIKARVKVASSFGLCQGILFFGGCVSLHFVSGSLTTYNHYIAGGILIVLGIRMLRECVQEYEDTCPNPVCQQKKCKQVKCLKTGKTRKLTYKLLIFYGIATSIDALAAGITFGLIYKQVLMASILVGGVAYVFSFVGATFGKVLGHLIGNKANIIGGVILIALGLKAIIG